MEFAKMGQNLLQSATGNISKAILVIRKVNNVSDNDNNADAGIDDVVVNTGKKPVEDVNEVNKSLMRLAEATLKGGKTASYKAVKAAAAEKQYLAIELQYNPTSLRLDTTAGTQRKYNGEVGDAQLREYVAPTSTTLSCDLLFDDFNNMDAFMLSDNPLTGATVSNIKNTVTSLVKGKFSVQRQMEGLLSLLTISEARHVIFYWGAMSFRGELVSVTTKYTMFNKKGYPIRGTVSIQIRQGGGNDERNENAYDDSYWMKSFDATFKEKKGGASGWQKATNNNLLNLKL